VPEPPAANRSLIDVAVSDAAGNSSAPQLAMPAVDAAETAQADAALADADAVTADADADGSGDEQDAAGQADVDAWLHNVLQRVQPGCEITVNALHMLGDLFETVRRICRGCNYPDVRAMAVFYGSTSEAWTCIQHVFLRHHASADRTLMSNLWKAVRILQLVARVVTEAQSCAEEAGPAGSPGSGCRRPDVLTSSEIQQVHPTLLQAHSMPTSGKSTLSKSGATRLLTERRIISLRDKAQCPWFSTIDLA